MVPIMMSRLESELESGSPGEGGVVFDGEGEEDRDWGVDDPLPTGRGYR